MEKILKQILEGQNLILDEIRMLSVRVGKLERRMDSLEKRMDKNEKEQKDQRELLVAILDHVATINSKQIKADSALTKMRSALDGYASA